jgi:hypothetical protein
MEREQLELDKPTVDLAVAIEREPTLENNWVI